MTMFRISQKDRVSLKGDWLEPSRRPSIWNPAPGELMPKAYAPFAPANQQAREL